jgi:hypothetical protein
VRRRAQAVVSNNEVRAWDNMVRSRFTWRVWGEDGQQGPGLMSQK